jgi:hypothetical protein
MPPPECVTVTLDLDADLLEMAQRAADRLAARDQQHHAVSDGNMERADTAAAPGQRGGLYP